VPADIDEAKEVEAEDTAEVTSDWTANEPEESEASVRSRVAYDQTWAAVRVEPEVRVRVPFVQTSEARVPKVVRDRAVDDQTLRGMVEAKDVEAVRTVASVWELMEVTAPETAVLVLALTAVVPAAMFEAREVEAARTVA